MAAESPLVLYSFINSICTQKVFMTLAEKGLDYEMRAVNLFQNEQYDPEYLKLNPRGVVPTLVDDGQPVTESTLICEYLDETHPEPPLMPSTPLGRARMRQWSKIIDEHIFTATGALSFAAQFREKMKEQTEEERQARYRNVGDVQRGDRFRSTFELGADSPYVLYAIADFEKLFSLLEPALAASGGPWIMGEDYTLADINLTPYLYRVEYLELLDLWLRDRPASQQWWERARQRPSALATIAERVPPPAIDEMRHFGGLIRPRIAERRDAYLQSLT